jgi:hypothetical protein
VTQENVNAVLPVLNISSEVKNEIRASVATSKVATVSQNNITVGSWTGVGYIIADPDTGAGAYRISGGSNGGSFDKETLVSYGMAILAVIFGIGGIWVFFVIGGGLSVLLAALFFVSLFAYAFSEGNPCTGFNWGLLALGYDGGMAFPLVNESLFASVVGGGIWQLRIVALITLFISAMGYFNPQSPPAENCPK